MESLPALHNCQIPEDIFEIGDDVDELIDQTDEGSDGPSEVYPIVKTI
jgi:hypothetical protein